MDITKAQHKLTLNKPQNNLKTQNLDEKINDGKPYHFIPLSEVFEYLHSNTGGLNEKQVKEQTTKFGLNLLKKVDKESLKTLFFNQFKDFLIIILIFAVFLSALVGELIDAFAILLILLLNGLLGFYQEYKAEKSIEALQSFISPKSKVLRSGTVQIIDSKYIVPGDIINLEAGDSVPADCRIIESFSLQADESSFTGESEPVLKDTSIQLSESTPVSDQLNMLFMGTNIVRGTATVICVKTGMDTVMGHITNMLITAEDRETPLKIKMNEFGQRLGWVILVICVAVVIIGILAIGTYTPVVILNMTIIGVALAVAAIPEGLPAVIVLALSIGVLRMSRQRAIVRKLRAVDTLGSTTVICSDKTGTLTQNNMTVEHIITAPFEHENQLLDINLSNQLIEKEPKSIEFLLKSAVCCNNSIIENNSNPVGDPTELALLVAGLKAGVHKRILEEAYPRILELPFDSSRKMMTTIHQFDTKNGRNQYIAFMKGAPDVVHDLSTKIQLKDELIKFNYGMKNKLKSIEQSYANSGLRLLAFAYRLISKEMLEKFVSTKNPDYSLVENDLIYLGIIAMRDPPRPEAIESIKT
ncbi:MAG: cation-translocating P-type ATPase, partial [Candidatus Hodarchaeales archaeon]